MLKKEHLFCSAPFRCANIHGHRIFRPAGDATGRRFFRPAGDVHLCCWLETPPIGTIHYQSVEEVWNSQKAQEIRRTILDGSFKYCSRDCPYLQTVSYEVQQRETVKDKELETVITNNFMEMRAFIHLGKLYNADVVSFSKIMNWGTFSEEEYKDRAIHLPEHPCHSKFIDMLNNEIFCDPIVHLGNLSGLIPHG